MELLATIAPLEDAVKHFGEKSVVASALRSKEWGKVNGEIRDASFFSAGVEDAKFLSTAQDKLQKAISLTRENLANGKSAFVDRSSFIGDLRKLALPLSDLDNPFADEGLTNIASSARLGLIYDMQTQMAQGFAERKMNLDPDVLDAYPAQELVRVEERAKPRDDWDARWQAACEDSGDDDAARVFSETGRMIALVSSPVWQSLGDGAGGFDDALGNPFGPFAWGSGMDLESLSRDDAEEVGLIQPGQNVSPDGDEPGFNDSLKSSVANLAPKIISALKSLFGGDAEISDGVISWSAA